VQDDLTLDQLRLFVSVASEGSFSAAGRAVSKAQSAVSYAIANLEQNIGVKLFSRAGRTPELTREGLALLSHARAVLGGVAELQGRAATMQHGVEPDLSIVIDAIVPSGMLVAIGHAFRAQFPTVSLRVHAGVLGSVASLVLDGTCDLGISGPVGSDDPALSQRYLSDVLIVPVAGPSHPLATMRGPIASMSLHEHVQLVISEGGNDSGGDQGVLSSTTWRVADASTKLDLIRAGLGWGHLPLALVEEDLSRGSLVQLSLEHWGPEPLRARLSAIVRRDRASGRACLWLLDELVPLCAGIPGMMSSSRGHRG